MPPRPIQNPPNPWHTSHVEWIGEPPRADLKVYHERVRSIVAENDSPDLSFRYSVNPYRGCFHACAYCYARPSHQYWDFGAGTDFERRIVVKVNAPERLREWLARPSRTGEVIVFSGNTDCYQPLEASYELTRRCLELCRLYCNPVQLITKGALVRRDIDVLAGLARQGKASVAFSIPFADAAMARHIEPAAPSPKIRLAAMRALSEAGIPVGVAVAPIIPGLNDDQMVDVLERARACGAQTAFKILLRLPGEVKQVFAERLREAYPDRFEKVMNGLREMRQGEVYRAGFHQRMRGIGPRWQAIERLFDMTCRRLGLNQRSGRKPAVQPADQEPAALPSPQLTLGFSDRGGRSR